MVVYRASPGKLPLSAAVPGSIWVEPTGRATAPDAAPTSAALNASTQELKPVTLETIAGKRSLRIGRSHRNLTIGHPAGLAIQRQPNFVLVEKSRRSSSSRRKVFGRVGNHTFEISMGSRCPSLLRIVSTALGRDPLAQRLTELIGPALGADLRIKLKRTIIRIESLRQVV
jgi:hypothetical protein